MEEISGSGYVKRKANSTEEVLYVIVHKKIQLQSEAQVLQNINP
jgi:hypothetical protein